jgi:hypothetical protein
LYVLQWKPEKQSETKKKKFQKVSLIGVEIEDGEDAEKVGHG